MSDYLRDRIAAAVSGENLLGINACYQVADAVIAELEHGEKPCGCRPIWKADDE